MNRQTKRRLFRNLSDKEVDGTVITLKRKLAVDIFMEDLGEIGDKFRKGYRK